MSNWTDIAQRLRAERDNFAKLAASRRRDAIAFRKEGRWLDALNADSRAREYRDSRDERSAELRRVKHHVARERSFRATQARLCRVDEPQSRGGEG